MPSLERNRGNNRARPNTRPRATDDPNNIDLAELSFEEADRNEIGDGSSEEHLSETATSSSTRRSTVAANASDGQWMGLRRTLVSLQRQTMNNRRRTRGQANGNAQVAAEPQVDSGFGHPLRRVSARAEPRRHHHRSYLANRAINHIPVGGLFPHPEVALFSDTAIEQALISTTDTENDSCVICRDPYDMDRHQPVKVPGCVHILGKACILRWLKENQLKMTCPMCRNPVEIPPVD